MHGSEEKERNESHIRCRLCDFFTNNVEKYVSHLLNLHQIVAEHIPRPSANDRRMSNLKFVYQCKDCDFETRKIVIMVTHRGSRKHNPGVENNVETMTWI